MPRDSPPTADQIEISLFGPGYGESVVVHLGSGEWMIVDSCLDAEGEPAALAYLRALRVDPSSAVKLVVATHWHDDHIGGLAEVVRVCDSARVAYSSAMHADDFYALVGLASKDPSKRSGVREFAEIVDELEQRKENGSLNYIPIPASENKGLWRRSGNPPGFVAALSPSDAAFHHAQQMIAAALVQSAPVAISVPDAEPNHASVALWVGVGDQRMLLGADLEETTDPLTGWTAVLNNAHLDGKPARVFKVPHHGSLNAHQPRVWGEALTARPFTVLAPWRLGGNRLPKPADRARIKGLADPRAYLTSGAAPTQRTRQRRATKLIRTSGVNPQVVEPPMGQVRFRRRLAPSARWSVALRGPAVPL